jgi:putative ABC transport system permease protein
LIARATEVIPRLQEVSSREFPSVLGTQVFALGIGANAAIFNLLHAVILRSLPVRDAEQLRLFSGIDENKAGEPIFSYPVLRQMQGAARDQAPLAGFSAISTMITVGENREPEPINTQLVTGSFFDVLGVKAQTGRLLSPSDDSLTSAYPAVLSGAFWAKRFGSDRSALGRFITVNDTPIRGCLVTSVSPARPSLQHQRMEQQRERL